MRKIGIVRAILLFLAWYRASQKYKINIINPKSIFVMFGDDASTKIKPSSPFFIGPKDKPGDKITSIHLKLNNFDDWVYDVSQALHVRRKFGFVDGTYTEPKPLCTKEDWETIQSMLISWLNNTIDPEVSSLLSKYDNAKRLWDYLHERFNIIDGPRIQQIKASLHDCRQTENMTVAVYYGKLSQLWDEPDKHEPLICCPCGSDVGKQHLARR
ncbi:uncharacterized protein LOC141643005 [Silene latifolia]|uniref:uncharacterized protein LOC141643005 n=1 Tax=Silene latifolia TaxID=37657 RepID=UPI003D779DBE